MCPFSFGILYSFGCCWCYNEAFSCDCYASKSQLNVCSSQKSACHFPRGLRQESVWEPVIFQGLHVCGLCSRNQKRQQQRYLPSPHYISLSDRVSPFCLSSSAHKYSGLSKRKEQQRLQRYMHHFPVPQRLSFFTSICKNQPHSSWFCMLHWTFAFCLAPLAVKKKFLLHSLSLPQSCRCFIQPQTSPPPRPVSVWMCWDFSIFFFLFSVCADCLPCVGCNGRAAKSSSPDTWKTKVFCSPANIVPALSHFCMRLVCCCFFFSAGQESPQVTLAISEVLCSKKITTATMFSNDNREKLQMKYLILTQYLQNKQFPMK